MPFFELGAVSDSVTGRGYKYVFRSNPTAKNFAEGMVDAVTHVIAPALQVDPKSLKIAIIHEDGPYGTLVGGFQKEDAKRLGLNVGHKCAVSRVCLVCAVADQPNLPL